VRLHPRRAIVSKARIEIGAAVNDAIGKHDLTYAELFGILAEVMQSWAKYAVRDERHPGDPDAKGDEA
jgi:hypothetical protein